MKLVILAVGYNGTCLLAHDLDVLGLIGLLQDHLDLSIHIQEPSRILGQLAFHFLAAYEERLEVGPCPLDLYEHSSNIRDARECLLPFYGGHGEVFVTAANDTLNSHLIRLGEVYKTGGDGAGISVSIRKNT